MMHNKESEKQPEMDDIGLSSSEEDSAAPSVMQAAPDERVSLSLLRRRVRAGWYEDDLHSQEARRLLFLRWLVREGLLSEWNETEK
ncbi:MAG TPA: hypothetical protein VH590_20555 [Ktedonobacterales bacterium]